MPWLVLTGVALLAGSALFGLLEARGRRTAAVIVLAAGGLATALLPLLGKNQDGGGQCLETGRLLLTQGAGVSQLFLGVFKFMTAVLELCLELLAPQFQQPEFMLRCLGQGFVVFRLFPFC